MDYQDYKENPKKHLFTFIDLFAGIGGIRLAFQKDGVMNSRLYTHFPRIMEEANRLQGPTNWLMRGLLSMHKKESA